MPSFSDLSDGWGVLAKVGVCLASEDVNVVLVSGVLDWSASESSLRCIAFGRVNFRGDTDVCCGVFVVVVGVGVYEVFVMLPGNGVLSLFGAEKVDVG